MQGYFSLSSLSTWYKYRLSASTFLQLDFRSLRRTSVRHFGIKVSGQKIDKACMAWSFNQMVKPPKNPTVVTVKHQWKQYEPFYESNVRKMSNQQEATSMFFVGFPWWRVPGPLAQVYGRPASPQRHQQLIFRSSWKPHVTTQSEFLTSLQSLQLPPDGLAIVWSCQKSWFLITWPLGARLHADWCAVHRRSWGSWGPGAEMIRRASSKEIARAPPGAKECVTDLADDMAPWLFWKVVKWWIP